MTATRHPKSWTGRQIIGSGSPSRRYEVIRHYRWMLMRTISAGYFRRRAAGLNG